MSFNYYQLYGLILKTKNSIKHLPKVSQFNEVDFIINFQVEAKKKDYAFIPEASEIYTSSGLAPNGLPILTIWKQYESIKAFLVIRYINDNEKVTFFVSDKKGEHLDVYYHPNNSANDIYTYLLGPVIGCVLRLKNKVCLHASVVNINEQAFAFIGEKGAGKSTLIAHFAAHGYSILSDDIAVLSKEENGFKVSTGYPRLRLWRESLAELKAIDIDTLTPVLTNLDKFYLPLNEISKTNWLFQNKPLPLAAVVYLNSRNETRDLALTELNPLESFLKLKGNVYAEYMLDTPLLKKEFEFFGVISQQLPVLSLERPNSLTYLADTRKYIVEWAKNIQI